MEEDEKLKKKKAYLEARSFPFEVTEVRKSEDGVTRIGGYAAVFNKLSEDLGGFREKIKRGFFSEVLGNDVRALFNHDDNMVLGRTTNDTLTLKEDSKGLEVEIIPPNTTYARDLTTLMERGDVNQMSFQWVTADDKWDESDLANVVRTLVKAESLWDVSPVTFPAYPQTTAGVRSAKQLYIDHVETRLAELQENKAEQEKEEEKERMFKKLSVIRRKLMILEKEN